MSRDRFKTVTGKEAFVLLLPASPKEATGKATFQLELGGDQPVRPFSVADRRQLPKKLKGVTGDHFFALLALRDALEARDDLALDKAKKRLEQVDLLHEREHPFQSSTSTPERQQFSELLAPLVGLSPDESLRHLEGRRPGPKAKGDWRRRLSYEVSQRVDFPNARLALWLMDDRQLSPAIYCKDPETALYLHTFLIAPRSGIGWRNCPHCSDPFFQKQANEDYCCPEHRDAHRVARFRFNKKNNLETQEEINGTKKTR